jgi:hypothetical protein
MSFQVALDCTLEMVEVDAKPFSTRELERGHEVAVTRDHDDDFHELPQREPGEIQTDAQVHSFLPEVGLDVPSCERTRSLRKDLQHSSSEPPVPRDELAQPQREIGR